jgi:lysophospholipase L1-like esterase
VNATRRMLRSTIATWALVIGLIALAGCGGGSSSDSPSIQREYWVVMGSSTAAGQGATTGQGWSDRLGRAYAPSGIVLINIAQAGTVTYHGLPTGTQMPAGRPAPMTGANIDRALSYSPKVVFIAYPTNDTINGYSAAETINNILRMRDFAIQRGASVIVLSTQPRNLSQANLEILQEIDRELSSVVGMCFVEIYAALADANGPLRASVDAGDGVHLNDAGHGVVLGLVMASILSGQCIRAPAVQS